jgi:hypothetical protein
VGKWFGSDIFSSILRNRRTTFIYTCDAPTDEKYNNPSTVVGVEWLFACPDIILVAMATTSNLAADIRADSTAFIGGQLAPHFSAQPDQIFSTLCNYNPRLTPCLRGSSFYNVTRIAAQEVWRQAALIHFHQVLAGLPAEHPTLQDCLKSLLSVYAIVEQGLPALLCGPMTVPMFLASTIAISPQDHNRLRRRHEGELSCFGWLLSLFRCTEILPSQQQLCMSTSVRETVTDSLRSSGATASPTASKWIGRSSQRLRSLYRIFRLTFVSRDAL